jgi:hypothetical protein
MPLRHRVSIDTRDTSPPADYYGSLLRSRETFTAGGHLFKAGDVVSADSPLVRAVLSEYPAVFQSIPKE